MGWFEVGPGFDPNAPISRARIAMLFNTMTGRFPVNHSYFLGQVRFWHDVVNHDAWYYLHVMIATNSFYVTLTEDGEYWVAIAENIDWSGLELPTARPGDVRR